VEGHNESKVNGKKYNSEDKEKKHKKRININCTEIKEIK